MFNTPFRISKVPSSPSFFISVVPIVVLLLGLVLLIGIGGSDLVSVYSPLILLSTSLLALCLAFIFSRVSRRGLLVGLHRSASQVLPAVPMLFCIAALSTTWMLCGIVPTLVDYGLALLNPQWFLVTTCISCAVVSVLTGSSWSTIATIGVSFMGIGSLMGYDMGWIAGAVISGAYFGDKVSPLSDTTVVASSTCGIDLFDHIRYLMITAVPAMSIALLIFGLKGFSMPSDFGAELPSYIAGLQHLFNITPWVLIIPAITFLLILLRVPTLVTLALSAIMGGIGVYVFQPALPMHIMELLSNVWSGYVCTSGNEVLDELISTGGIMGMLPTICLVLSAMVFGSVMIGTGMLASIASGIMKYLDNRKSVVGATVGAGLCANCCTADQYLSLIITGNMFRGVYRKARLELRLLSRTMEDSVSVTSVLIPWNSCGVTQSTVLGVATLTYLPYCFFNYLSPLMSLLIVWTGFKVRTAVSRTLARA